MPTPPPAMNDVWLCRLDGRLDTTPCANVLAFRDELGGLTATEVTDQIEDGLDAVLGSATGTSYQNMISTLRTWTNLHVVRYNAADPDVVDRPLSGINWQGNNATHALPPQTAVAVTLRTAIASRRARGRLFDYGITEESNEANGRLREADRQVLQAFWAAVRNEYETNHNIVWVVLSRGWVNEGASDPRPSYAQGTRNITSVIVRDNVFDTVRSRAR